MLKYVFLLGEYKYVSLKKKKTASAYKSGWLNTLKKKKASSTEYLLYNPEVSALLVIIYDGVGGSFVAYCNV